MSIYPPNNTTPKSPSGSYLWNWLGSPLKKFAAALSPYLGGGDSGVKVYRALLTQSGNNPPTAVVLENTIGDLTFGYDGVGAYYIYSVDGLFLENKVFILSSNTYTNTTYGQQLNSTSFDRYSDTSILIYSIYYNNEYPPFEQKDSILYNTPIEILIYP